MMPMKVTLNRSRMGGYYKRGVPVGFEETLLIKRPGLFRKAPPEDTWDVKKVKDGILWLEGNSTR